MHSTPHGFLIWCGGCAAAPYQNLGLAQRSCIELRITWGPGKLQLELRDNGVGFDPHQPRAEGHYGLGLMQEAVDALQGAIRIESGTGKGTGIQIRIPLRLAEAGQPATQAWLNQPLELEVGR